MMTPEDFKSCYRTISHAELIDILDHPDRYQPAALAAAREELASRQLTEPQIDDARAPFAERLRQQQDKKEKIEAFGDQVRNAGRLFFEIASPAPTANRTVVRTIKIIALVYGGMAIISIITDHRMILLSIKNMPQYPVLGFLSLLSLIIMPWAAIDFWRRKPGGWTLLTFMIGLLVAMASMNLAGALRWRSSGIANLDRLYHPTPPWMFMFQLIFLVGTLYIICKPSVRELFMIGGRKMKRTIIAGVLSGLGLLFLLWLTRPEKAIH